jgi:hypothetical protein
MLLKQLPRELELYTVLLEPFLGKLDPSVAIRRNKDCGMVTFIPGGLLPVHTIYICARPTNMNSKWNLAPLHWAFEAYCCSTQYWEVYL